MREQEPGAAPDAANGWTEDRLLGGRVLLRQPRTGYRAGIDPVILAAAVDAAPGELVLDAGCGVGAAALCLAQRLADVRITGIDQDGALIETARANAAANQRADRLMFHAADLLQPPGALAAALAAAGFDHVMANPPHFAADAGQPARDPGRRAAAVEGRARLEHWARFCIRMVRPGGTVTWVHRADRLPAILTVLGEGLGGIKVYPLWPGGGQPKPAGRVLVAGRRGSAGRFCLLPGLTLHGADGHFSPAAEAVLRHAAAIAW